MDSGAYARFWQLQDGYLITQLMYVAAELGVADALAGGPRTADSLAAELGANPGALHRVLRGLAAHGVLDEPGDGRFSLTPIGELLRSGTPDSLRRMVLNRGAIYYRVLDHLIDAVRDGQNPFELTYGMSFFDYLATRPDEQSAFQISMTERSVHEAKAVLAAYDFSRFHSLVDVGGGQGVLLSAILAANPGMTGILFDQPAVVASAQPNLPNGCEVVGGDFFHEIPAGADGYLMSRVIHNWSHEDAVRILRNCRAAMPDDGTLLMVEIMLPEHAAEAPAAIRMDVSMLALFPGRERTRAEFSALLDDADLLLDDAIPTNTSAGVWILLARPK
jgi:hypothetical protein